MKRLRVIIALAAIALVLPAVAWLTLVTVRELGRGAPAGPPTSDPAGPATGPAAQTLRIGLVPEHDVFRLRQSYRPLGQHLSERLGVPVQMVTLASYEAAVLELGEGRLDGAFLGSLVACLAIDRQGACPIVKPIGRHDAGTYRGVIFVRDDSPIRSLEQAAGKRLAVIRATMAGSLFPVAEFGRRGMLEGDRAVRMVPMGTHDEAIEAVLTGRADVGAAKNLRLEARLRTDPAARNAIRRLAESEPVPNNALVMRSDRCANPGRRLAEALLALEGEATAGNASARAALDSLNVVRFVPCAAAEYDGVRRMIREVGDDWSRVGVARSMTVRPPVGPPAVHDATAAAGGADDGKGD